MVEVISKTFKVKMIIFSQEEVAALIQIVYDPISLVYVGIAVNQKLLTKSIEAKLLGTPVELQIIVSPQYEYGRENQPNQRFDII